MGEGDVGRAGDNIFVWDFHAARDGGRALPGAEYAAGAPGFAPERDVLKRVAPLFGQRVVDVIEGRGDTADVTGKGGQPLPPVDPAPEPEPERSPGPEPDPGPDPGPEADPRPNRLRT